MGKKPIKKIEQGTNYKMRALKLYFGVNTLKEVKSELRKYGYPFVYEKEKGIYILDEPRPCFDQVHEFMTRKLRVPYDSSVLAFAYSFMYLINNCSELSPQEAVKYVKENIGYIFTEKQVRTARYFCNKSDFDKTMFCKVIREFEFQKKRNINEMGFIIITNSPKKANVIIKEIEDLYIYLDNSEAHENLRRFYQIKLIKDGTKILKVKFKNAYEKKLYTKLYSDCKLIEYVDEEDWLYQD